MSVTLVQINPEAGDQRVHRVAEAYGARYVRELAVVRPMHEVADGLRLEYPDATLVGIEVDAMAMDLRAFKHPHGDVVYVTGSMNRGLPQELLRRLDSIVVVPTANGLLLSPESAVTAVLYDRLAVAA